MVRVHREVQNEDVWTNVHVRRGAFEKTCNSRLFVEGSRRHKVVKRGRETT